MTAGGAGWRRAWRQVMQPPRSVEEGNERLLYREIAWYGVVNGIAGTFASVFAVRLGASNQLLGLLASLPALVSITLQLPAARLVERQAHLRRVMVASFFFNRLGYLAVALIPWALAAWRPQALIGVAALMTVPATVANIAFIAMMAEVVGPQRRARVVSIRNMLIALTTTVTVLATGRLLDLFPFPINYQGAFLAGFAASLLSLADLMRLRVPGDEGPHLRSSRPAVPWRTILANRTFTRYTAVAFLVNFSLSVPAALYTLYRVRVLHATDTWIGLLGTVETGVSIAAAYFWGRQAAKRGFRPLLLISVLGFALYPLLTALSTRLEPLLFIAVTGGIFGPANSIAMFNLLLEVCPQEGRPAYIGVYNVLANVAAFAAPLLGTTIADWVDIRAGLLVAAALRVATASALVWWMRSERQATIPLRLRTL